MTRRIPINPPITLSTVRAPAINLPQIVKHIIKNHILPHFRPDGPNGRILIRLGRNGQIVGLALRRPARFRHHDGFRSARGIAHQIHPLLHEIAGGGGEHVPVEEGVAVDGAEVRGVAQVRVGFHGDHGVDRHDGAAVSGALEGAAHLADGRGDLADRGPARVDELVADADGLDDAPVAAHGADDGLAFVGDLGNVEDAEEQCNAFALDGCNHVGHLVAVRAIQPDDRVPGDGL